MWIESHQELATNPKTRRAARLLGIPIPHLIGHLHMLWWWTLDHAFDDGDLSGYDELDIADAAGWEGDAGEFVQALIDCGPRDRNGFLTAGWQVNDWPEFTAALRASRRSSLAGNHTRHHVQRGIVNPECPLCQESDGSPAGADSRPTGVPREQVGSPEGPGRESTEPDLTEPTPAADAASDHQSLWITLAEVCGLDTGKVTKSEGGRLGKAAKELTEVGATPDEIRAKAKAYRQQFGDDISLTPTGLVANWSKLEAAKASPPVALVGTPEWEAQQAKLAAERERLIAGDSA